MYDFLKNKSIPSSDYNQYFFKLGIVRRNFKIPAIYQILNNQTNTCYIGQSMNVYNRLTVHLGKLLKNRHSIPELQKDFNKWKLFSLKNEGSYLKMNILNSLPHINSESPINSYREILRINERREIYKYHKSGYNFYNKNIISRIKKILEEVENLG